MNPTGIIVILSVVLGGTITAVVAWVWYWWRHKEDGEELADELLDADIGADRAMETPDKAFVVRIADDLIEDKEE